MPRHPLHRLALCGALALACSVSALPGPSSGEARAQPQSVPGPARTPPSPATFEELYEIRELAPFPDGAFRARSLSAWIPRRGEGPCRVLLVLDGQGARDWFALDRAALTVSALQADRWVIVPIPSSSERTRELRRLDADFGRTVRDHVWATLGAQVPLAEGPVHAVVGYSYGGLSALAFGLELPETFGRVIAMSPSLWFRERGILRRIAEARRLPARVWLDVGMDEVGPRPAPLPNMVADARLAREALLDRGLRFGDQLGYFEAPGEAHDMAAGGRRIEQALDFALGDRASPPRTLALHRYPAVRGQAAFAVQLTREDGSRWTVPPRLFEAREGSARIRRTMASSTRALHVEAFGLVADLPP